MAILILYLFEIVTVDSLVSAIVSGQFEIIKNIRSVISHLTFTY